MCVCVCECCFFSFLIFVFFFLPCFFFFFFFFFFLFFFSFLFFSSFSSCSCLSSRSSCFCCSSFFFLLFFILNLLCHPCMHCRASLRNLSSKDQLGQFAWPDSSPMPAAPPLRQPFGKKGVTTRVGGRELGTQVHVLSTLLTPFKGLPYFRGGA